MAILIIILIICLMIHFGEKGRVVRIEKKLARRHKEYALNSRVKKRMSREETDELITVILPTINNDK